MDSERKKFLSRRLKEATKGQPELKHLKRILLRLGGELLVAPPKPDPDVSRLLRDGFVMGGPTVLKVMKQSSCHQNVALLWKHNKRAIVAIATGYALSPDGLWRQHTWGILREGVLETTEARVKYFGIVLQGDVADDFVECNPA